MQQCVGKHLKAYLTLHGKSFRRTHDIAELIEACKEISLDFEALYELRADHLTVYGVDIRHPDDFHLPAWEEAQECTQIARATRELVRKQLKQAGFEGL